MVLLIFAYGELGVVPAGQHFLHVGEDGLFLIGEVGQELFLIIQKEAPDNALLLVLTRDHHLFQGIFHEGEHDLGVIAVGFAEIPQDVVQVCVLESLAGGPIAVIAVDPADEEEGLGVYPRLFAHFGHAFLPEAQRQAHATEYA